MRRGEETGRRRQTYALMLVSLNLSMTCTMDGKADERGPEGAATKVERYLEVPAGIMSRFFIVGRGRSAHMLLLVQSVSSILQKMRA